MRSGVALPLCLGVALRLCHVAAFLAAALLLDMRATPEFLFAALTPSSAWVWFSTNVTHVNILDPDSSSYPGSKGPMDRT